MNVSGVLLCADRVDITNEPGFSRAQSSSQV